MQEKGEAGPKSITSVRWTVTLKQIHPFTAPTPAGHSFCHPTVCITRVRAALWLMTLYRLKLLTGGETSKYHLQYVQDVPNETLQQSSLTLTTDLATVF